MSERTTDEERQRGVAKAWSERKWEGVARFHEKEADRARASEVAKDAALFGLESEVALLQQSQATQKMVIGELRKDVAAKDATIRALADALEYAKQYVPSGSTLAIVERALLAAGRLP